MNRTELLRLAQAGAEARIHQLQQEIDTLRRAFPKGHAGNGAAGIVPERRPRQMSAAGRKRIADAARKRWAAWRKAKQKEQ